MGFEPTEPAKVQRFSRPPDSTTLAPHRTSMLPDFHHLPKLSLCSFLARRSECHYFVTRIHGLHASTIVDRRKSRETSSNGFQFKERTHRHHHSHRPCESILHMLRFTVVVVYFFVACALAAADNQEVKSLQGLPPLVVDVRVVAPISVGISEGDLKKAIELRLRSSGIKIASGLDTLLAPQVFVSVTAPTSQVGLYAVSATLIQFVKPWRPDATSVTCSESSVQL